MRRAILVLVALLAAGTPGRSESSKPSPWNWDQWRNLPVQDGGRQKPLDTLAWETFRSLSNRTSFADPQTVEPLDSTALYLAMVFEWPGWDRPLNPQATDAELRAGYFASRQPDKWDVSRLLLVDSLELRRNLGMSQDQKYISPWKLSQAKIRDPRTARRPSSSIGPSGRWTAKSRARRRWKESPWSWPIATGPTRTSAWASG